MFASTTLKKTIRAACRKAAVAILAYATAQGAGALEVAAGDYEAFPAGANAAILYFQHADRSDLYAGGNRVASNFDLTSQIGIARFIHVAKLTESAVIDPQVILPFGSLKTGGIAGALGNADGLADLIVGAPVKWILDPATRDVFSVGPFLYLPTGSYDNSRVLNLGENRWKGLLQLAYIRHFNATWALDLVGDVTVHGKNTDFTPAHATLKQDPRYEAQAHLRYNLSPATSLALSYGKVWGGETEVNGARQNDRLNTHYARLTATSFIDQATQLQVQYGQDLSVENGPRERNRINLRVVRLF